MKKNFWKPATSTIPGPVDFKPITVPDDESDDECDDSYDEKRGDLASKYNELASKYNELASKYNELSRFQVIITGSENDNSSKRCKLFI